MAFASHANCSLRSERSACRSARTLIATVRFGVARAIDIAHSTSAYPWAYLMRPYTASLEIAA